MIFGKWLRLDDKGGDAPRWIAKGVVVALVIGAFGAAGLSGALAQTDSDDWPFPGGASGVASGIFADDDFLADIFDDDFFSGVFDNDVATGGGNVNVGGNIGGGITVGGSSGGGISVGSGVGSGSGGGGGGDRSGSGPGDSSGSGGGDMSGGGGY